MSFLTLMVTVALVATMGSLAFGVSSMVRDGEVGNVDSQHWMEIRVLLQAATIVVVALALFLAA